MLGFTGTFDEQVTAISAFPKTFKWLEPDDVNGETQMIAQYFARGANLDDIAGVIKDKGLTNVRVVYHLPPMQR